MIALSAKRIAAVAAVVVLAVLGLVVPGPLQAPARAQAVGDPARLDATCGNSVAFAMDLSYNVGWLFSTTPEGDVWALRDSIKSYIDSQSNPANRNYANLGLYTYNSVSPAAGAGVNNLPATSMATPEGRNKLTSFMNNMRAYGRNTGAMNWQAALGAIRRDMESGVHYDTVYIATKWSPTADNSGDGGDWTRPSRSELDAAAAEKAKIEAMGAKVKILATGAYYAGGDAYSQREMKITEPNGTVTAMGHPQWAESFVGKGNLSIVKDYKNIGDPLSAAPKPGGCLRVSKNILGSDGSAKPTSGWGFTMKASGQGLSSAAASGTKSTTGSFGDLGWHYAAGTAGAGANLTVTFTIEEENRAGYRPAADPVKCVAVDAYNRTQSRSLAVQRTSDTAFTVSAQQSETVDCSVTNQQSVAVNVASKAETSGAMLPEAKAQIDAAKYRVDYACVAGGKDVGKGTLTLDAGQNQALPAEVPVGAQCTFTREKPIANTAAFTTSTEWFIGGKSAGTGLQTTATITGATTVQPVTRYAAVVDTRPRADLSVAYSYDTSSPDSVHQYLVNAQAPRDVQWTCKDGAQTYTGTAHPVPGGPAVPIQREGLPAGVDPCLPQGTTCTFTQDPQQKLPAGFAGKVRVNSKAQLTGSTRSEVIRETGAPTIADVVAGQGNARTVVFVDAYTQPRQEIGVIHTVGGDVDGKLVPKDRQDLFSYKYRCDFSSLLPGQPEPFPAEGGGFITAAGSWRPGKVPVGTTCTYAEQAPSKALGQILDPHGLRVSPLYTYVRDEQDPWASKVLSPLQWGDEIKLTTGEQNASGAESGAPNGAAGPRPVARFIAALSGGDATLNVQKVNPDGKPLGGSQFAIYPAVNGRMGDTPVLEVLGQSDGGDPSRFTAKLGPGSYYLVETRAGTNSQLLPQPWAFTVVGEDIQLDSSGLLKFHLTDYANHSGLIEAKAPADNSKPWIIQVANVKAGSMPLTGGVGVWWLLGAGGALIVGGLWLGRRWLAAGKRA